MTEIRPEEMRQRLGNIEQLRDILFGEKIEEYEQQFDGYFQRINQLETELSQWQKMVDSRLEQLQKKLNQEIHGRVIELENKLSYLDLNTKQETKDIQRQLQNVVKSNGQNSDALQEQLLSQTKHWQQELKHNKEILTQEIQVLRQQVFTELENKIAQLTDTKVSRADLAGILFELCMKVKETPSQSTLPEVNNTQAKTELLLPEQSSEQSNNDHND